MLAAPWPGDLRVLPARARHNRGTATLAVSHSHARDPCPLVGDMKLQIDVPHERLEALCTRWQVAELALFGSALRADFAPDSDIDLLVRFRPEAKHTLLDLAEMEHELSDAFGRRTDLVERSAIERSPNYIRRRAILASAETIYAA